MIDSMPPEWAVPAAVVLAVIYLLQSRGDRVAARRARKQARS